jgi:hypothetical protein
MSAYTQVTVHKQEIGVGEGEVDKRLEIGPVQAFGN